MNRRLLLTSMAAIAASPVLAQTNAAQTPASNAPNQGNNSPNQPQGRLSQEQLTHIKDTLTWGSLSLMLSRIAKPKVSLPALKQFVDFEIAEQQTVADVLQAIQTHAAPNGSVPVPSDDQVMQNVDETGKKAIQTLRAAREGRDFDMEYIRLEIEGHQKLLSFQEAYLKAPDNLDETNFAKMASAVIHMHITMLDDMRSGRQAAR